MKCYRYLSVLLISLVASGASAASLGELSKSKTKVNSAEAERLEQKVKSKETIYQNKNV